MNTDINAYFSYVEDIINKSTATEEDKKVYKNVISCFKVTGVVSVDDIRDESYLETKDLNEELYVLYEVLSFKFFNLLNYWAWKNRMEG